MGKVNDSLMTASTLHWFNQTKQFKLTTVVSHSGLGAALLQHKTWAACTWKSLRNLCLCGHGAAQHRMWESWVYQSACNKWPGFGFRRASHPLWKITLGGATYRDAKILFEKVTAWCAETEGHTCCAGSEMKWDLLWHKSKGEAPLLLLLLFLFMK